MLRRLKNWFYSGPRDLGFRLRGRSGYQSPTVTMGAWLVAVAVRYLTFPGRCTLICCALLVPYSLVTTAMPIYVLAFAVLMLFFFDIVVGFLLRPRLAIRRDFPARVAEGAELNVSYRVRNLCRSSAWNVQLDTLPFPQAVSVRRRPEGALRLLPGGELHGSSTWMAKRRGEQTIPAVRCVCAFPFGLFSWGKTEGRAQSLLVYPRFSHLARVDLSIGERYQPEGESVSSKSGLSMEFLGCREFRDGDDLRRLHMRSWARTGFPVVKEFRQEYMARTGIVLDTFLERRLFEEVRQRYWARPQFEAIVSLAAALVDYFAGHDSRVDLFATGTEVHHFGGSHGMEYLDRVLDILAGVNYSARDRFEALGERLAPYLRKTSGIVFVLGRWDRARQRVVEDVLSAGVQCRAIIVQENGVGDRLPDYATVVSHADVLAGRCTAL